MSELLGNKGACKNSKIKGIRASSLPNLFQCVRSLTFRDDAVSNGFADTGSLIHVGIEALHKLQSIDSALAIMALSQPDYPEANTAKAVHHFRRYTEEQQQWGKCEHTEYPISFTLAPAPFDPTKEEIVIEGTIDQVRDNGAGLCVVDVKSGSKPLKWMMRHHAPQLAAYQYGFFNLTGVQPHAAIIRTMDFLQGGKIYHPVPWAWPVVMDILDTVRILIALYRMGLKIAIPGEHCEYCPAMGIEHCGQGTMPTNQQRIALPQVQSIEDLFTSGK